MKTDVFEVLDCIESEVVVLAGALSGVARLMPNDDQVSDVRDLFMAMSKNAGDILNTIEFWRGQIKKDAGAHSGEIATQHPLETSLPEVTADVQE